MTNKVRITIEENRNPMYHRFTVTIHHKGDKDEMLSGKSLGALLAKVAKSLMNEES